MHRFLWDLHGQPLAEAEADYPMTAVAHGTASQSTASWVLPGEYRLSLTTNEKTLTQPLTVKMDPRIHASSAELTTQFVASEKLIELRRKLEPIGKSYESIVRQLEKLAETGNDRGLGSHIEMLRKKLEAFANPASVRADGPLQFDLLDKVKKLFTDLQQVDAAPTSQQASTVGELEVRSQTVIKNWETIPSEVSALNAQLTAAGLVPIKFP